jgi:hypothetical protein
MTKEEIRNLIEEAKHQQESFHRVSGKLSEKLIKALDELNNHVVLGDVIASDPDSSSELFEEGNYRCKCGMMKIDCDQWEDCKVKESLKSK